MDFLQYGTLVVLMTVLFYHCCSCERYKRNNYDNFNIMLRLFKVKPLGSSNVFKTFSHTMLLPASDPIHLSDIKFNEKEFAQDNKSAYNNQNDDKNGEPPFVQEELEQEPIKENVIDHKAEPYFEAVDKLEFFEDQNPELEFNGLKKKKHRRQKHISQPENFISNNNFYVTKDDTKRLLRSTKHNIDADVDNDAEYTKSSEEPLIL